MADCLERPALTPEAMRPSQSGASRIRNEALVTPRLLLDRPEVGDAVALSAALSDFAVARMMANLPQPFLPGDALDWILAWRHGEDESEVRLLRLHNPMAGQQAGQAVGAVTLKTDRGAMVLAYWLTRPLWGNGLIGEAVSAVLGRHFAAKPGVPVRSGIMADNSASLRLQERLGFAITGVRDIWSVPRGQMVHLIETELTADAFAAA